MWDRLREAQQRQLSGSHFRGLHDVLSQVHYTYGSRQLASAPAGVVAHKVRGMRRPGLVCGRRGGSRVGGAGRLSGTTADMAPPTNPRTCNVFSTAILFLYKNYNDYQVDLSTGEGLTQAFEQVRGPHGLHGTLRQRGLHGTLRQRGLWRT